MNLNVTARLVLHWAVSTFGPVALDHRERAARYVEEAIELGQTESIPLEMVIAIAQRVYGKPPGNNRQEIADGFITLLSYCAVKGIDPEVAFDEGLAKVMSRKREFLVEKHNAKVAAGTAFSEAK